MIIADSNLVIALLLEHPQHAQAAALLGRDPDWHFPDWWLIEVSNALRNYHRAGQLSEADAMLALSRAQSLFAPTATHQVDLASTLRIACEANISAYDGRFIALSRQMNQKLVTEDTRLRTACPDDTLSLEEALAG